MQSQFRTLDFAVLLIVFIVLLWRRLKFSLINNNLYEVTQKKYLILQERC